MNWGHFVCLGRTEVNVYRLWFAIGYSLLLPQLSGAESPQLTVVRAARMLDVRSGEIVKNVVVVVEKDRIKAV